MALDIKSIQSIVNKDFVRGNKFSVIMSGAIAAGTDITDHLISANFAGLSYGTVDYRNASPVLKLPNDIIYFPLRLSFHNDAQGKVLTHFQNLNRNKIIADVKSDYSLNFFEEYTGDVELTQYNPQNQTANKMKYVNAWVQEVQDIQLSVENSNVIQVVEVVLLYEYSEPV